MKQYFIDILIVLLILCIGKIYFSDYNVEKVLLNRNINSFEETINNSETTVSYGTSIDSEDNKISLFMKSISDLLVHIIEDIVYVFSEIISMLFINVVYL